MATITQVSMGREGHYRATRLYNDRDATQGALCECGAEWHRDAHPDTTSLNDWMITHQPPVVTRATVLCTGSYGLISENATDGNHIGWCHICQRYRPTYPQPGYDGWRQFDPHPVFVAAAS